MSIDRRQFNGLSTAALAGLLAGCGQTASKPAPVAPPATPVAMGPEKHLCRGLNDCKGLGKSGKNECRGQGDCATIEQQCGGSNACKGLGGCGETAGENACKGQGGCHTPLMDGAWKKVRKLKTDAWEKASEKFGEAPAKST